MINLNKSLYYHTKRVTIEKNDILIESFLRIAQSEESKNGNTLKIAQNELSLFRKYISVPQVRLRHKKKEEKEEEFLVCANIYTYFFLLLLSGTTKLYYDIWGDAVNTASRMDSYGMPNRIQVA